MFHAAGLAAAFIIWPKLAPPLVLPSDIVPVELQVADETNITPEEKAPDPPPEPQQLPMPAIPEPQMAVPEPPPPPPAEDELALEEDKKPPEEKQQLAQPRFAMAQPRIKPKPEKKKDEFDIDKITNLVDNIDKQKPKTDSKAPSMPQSKRSLQGAGAQSAMTASEIDAFKSQLRKCWNVPVGAPDPAALVFRVRIYLNPDGTVEIGRAHV